MIEGIEIEYTSDDHMKRVALDAMAELLMEIIAYKAPNSQSPITTQQIAYALYRVRGRYDHA